MISLQFYEVYLCNIPDTQSSPLILTFTSSCHITKKIPGGSDWKNAVDKMLPK